MGASRRPSIFRGPLKVIAVAVVCNLACAQENDYRHWPVRLRPSFDYDVLHYRVELAFDVPRKSYEGQCSVTFSARRPGFDRIDLDAENLVVRGISLAGGEALSFSHVGGKLSVALDQVYAEGDTLTLAIVYGWKQIAVDNEAYGMSKEYDIGLRFLEATPEHPELIQTLSFPTGARHWFPCNDHPSDKATYEFLVTVPDSFSVLANGRLVSVRKAPAAGTSVFHWKQELPHSTYLTVLTAGPYAVLRDSLNGLPLGYWVYPNDVPDAMRSFHRTPQIIDFYATLYGVPYPWAKYDQIIVPGIGGGAESTSATILGQATIHDERAEQDFPSHWLVAHEASHQWWGDLVTLSDWGHTWINEAFATYGEYLYSRYTLGDDEGAVNLLDKKNAYLSEATSRYMRPIVLDRWRFPNDNFDRHTYQKGAAVLHMLRTVVGDEKFFAIQTAFLKRFAFACADTRDFIATAEEVSGQSLGWFFDQWLYRPGHPRLDVSAEWDPAEQRLRMEIHQVQDSTGGVPVFEFPVVIGLIGPTTVERETLWVRTRKEVFMLASSEEPLLVRFDEGNTLLKEWTFRKSTAALLFQLEHDDVPGRMWAAKELVGRIDTEGVRAALLQCASRDPFWAVRRTAVEAIAAAQGGADERDFFQDRLGDPNSKVRVAALRALGDLALPALRDLFVESFRKDDSYLVQAEALRSLGKLKDPDTEELFRSALALRSPRGVVRLAASWGLDQLSKGSIVE